MLLGAVSLALPQWRRTLGHLKSAAVTVQLALALWYLLRDLTSHRGHPVALLQGALILWSMNILVFASWYWLLDAGGPHRRARRQAYCGGAFLFPQVTLPPDLRPEIWQPRFVDYLFLAFNTSTAFSPTDVPVLSVWAKVLMMIQASISLTTLAAVAARAINIL